MAPFPEKHVSPGLSTHIRRVTDNLGTEKMNNQNRKYSFSLEQVKPAATCYVTDCSARNSSGGVSSVYRKTWRVRFGETNAERYIRIEKKKKGKSVTTCVPTDDVRTWLIVRALPKVGRHTTKLLQPTSEAFGSERAGSTRARKNPWRIGNDEKRDVCPLITYHDYGCSSRRWLGLVTSGSGVRSAHYPNTRTDIERVLRRWRLTKTRSHWDAVKPTAVSDETSRKYSRTRDRTGGKKKDSVFSSRTNECVLWDFSKSNVRVRRNRLKCCQRSKSDRSV